MGKPGKYILTPESGTETGARASGTGTVQPLQPPAPERNAGPYGGCWMSSGNHPLRWCYGMAAIFRHRERHRLLISFFVTVGPCGDCL